MHNNYLRVGRGASILAALLLSVSAWAGGKAFTIEAQDLGGALKAFALQANREIFFAPELTLGKKSRGISGTYNDLAALDVLLTDTGLTYSVTESKAILLRDPNRPPVSQQTGVDPSGGVRLVQAEGAKTSSAAAAEEKPDSAATKGIPEILVQGSKILNMDIKRSRDDVQPYVVFERATFEQSGAVNLEEFLKQRLTMNTTSVSPAQSPGGASSASSQINLRGLGANQTLILIDGHRTASWSNAGVPQQPSVNTVPIAAIERVEVLPTTASGIYGGSATGGVINIVLRRDYVGSELRLGYDNTFDTDSAIRKLDYSAGFSLEGGKTNVLLVGSYSDANPLRIGDRDLFKDARLRILANNPANYLSSVTPPLGATTNIRSSTGVNLTLKSGPALNSPITYIPSGYAGRASDNGVALLANAGRYNFDLANTAQAGGGGRAGLLSSPTAESISATVRREFSARVQGFLELSAANNTNEALVNSASSTFVIPDTAANNPFVQTIRVTTPAFGADALAVTANYNRRALGGLIVKLPRDWLLGTDFTWVRMRSYYSSPGALTAAATPAVTGGSIDVLRDTNIFPVDFSPFVNIATKNEPVHSTLKDAVVRVAGPLWQLPAGILMLSTMFEHQEDAIDDTVQISSFGTTLTPRREQTVKSAYLELNVPLVSAANAMPGVAALDLQLAGRRDEYEVTGSGVISAQPVFRSNKNTSDNPTLGLRYQPVPDVMFRASYGTGFLPPAVNQLVESPLFTLTPAQNIGLTDPRRGGEALGFVQLRSGGNANLAPEKSTSRSAGIVWMPRALPDLRLSVDWTRIEKEENIATFSLQQPNIELELFVPGLITRGAAVPNDPFGVGAITGWNNTPINISRATVESYDVALDYGFDMAAFGRFDLALSGTRMMHFITQGAPGGPSIENVGLAVIFGGGPKWKASSSVVWNYRQTTVGWNARYVDSYWLNSAHTVVVNQGSATIPAQTFHDLFATYKFAGTSRWLAGTEAQLGVKNVLNTEPAFSTFNANLLYNPWGDPRMASYYLSIKRAF